MKILKAQFMGDDGRLYAASAIAYEGSLWLVPDWIVSPDGRSGRPTRMIRLDSVRHQRIDGAEIDVFVNDPIPIAVVKGEPSPEEGTFDVLEDPNISVPVPETRH